MPTLRFRLLTPMLLAVVPAALLPSAMAVAQSGAPAADAPPPPPPPPPSQGLWAADSNHDGQLTREEVTAFLSARFAELDSDGDGWIPVATLARLQGGERPPRHDGRAHGDDRGERRGPPPGGGPGGGGFGGPPGGPGGPPPGGRRGPPPEGREDAPPSDGLPRAEDRNEDGMIDRAEFLAPVDELFENRDRNGDGVLTPDELPPPPPPPARSDHPDRPRDDDPSGGE